MKYILFYSALIALSACSDSHDPDRTAEKSAIKSESHPYAGFWKHENCNDAFGIAIAPVDNDHYSLSFCGPGGCFKPGTYRPNSSIKGDPNYKVHNIDTIEILGSDGFSMYVRCKQR